MSATLSIIGTAGRKEDGKRLRTEHYPRMVNAARMLISHLQIDLSELHLCSGGAAWADHVAVTLIKEGLLPPLQLTLFMPCPIGPSGYYGQSARAEKTADTANYYHHVFSQMVGIDSFAEIRALGERGTHLVAGDGDFKRRNSDVASDCTPDGFLLAFTFGSVNSHQMPWTIKEHHWSSRSEEAGVKPGGSADTWSKAGCRKFHCRLGDI